ncbi:MAG: hypothetical protein R3277_10865 [Brumimicrobium sp.]|nr:hypothetical protein [Brumimicrobium sp.]
MKRVQLFEFEDQSWFPDFFRSSLTRLLSFLLRLMNLKKPVAELLKAKLKEIDTQHIVDLGSGAGGVMIDVFREIKQEDQFSEVTLTLTDLYPNTEAVHRINNTKEAGLRYKEEPVDATRISSAPEGLKTLVNSFHHLPKDKAAAVLKSCVENKTPILIYEMAHNSLPTILWWLLLPPSLIILMVMALVMTPFVRPLSWKQLFFTYVIPIIPLTYAWDGQASYARTYSFADFKELLEGIDLSAYDFEIDFLKHVSEGKAPGYYVFGKPKK